MKGKSESIVNPAKLDGWTRRDAVCMQCHLEGKAAIERPGRHIYDVQPWASSFRIMFGILCLPTSHAPCLGAVSQFEALAQSVCKKKSGEAMSCTSCHDPHSEPSAMERVSYYRQKCLACHGVKLRGKARITRINPTAPAVPHAGCRQH